jgi:hypothetical protein
MGWCVQGLLLGFQLVGQTCWRTTYDLPQPALPAALLYRTRWAGDTASALKKRPTLSTDESGGVQPGRLGALDEPGPECSGSR